MSKPWRIAGLIVAASVFVLTVADPVADPPPFLEGIPSVVLAAARAVLAFVVVWFYEGVFQAARWVYRAVQWMWGPGTPRDHQ
jgi:hypothetical protein